MKNEALYRNFENIPSRKGRGGVYPYVRWQDVADRMNEVFGTNWSSEVLFQDIIGANVIVRVRVSSSSSGEVGCLGVACLLATTESPTLPIRCRHVRLRAVLQTEIVFRNT